MIRSRRGVRNAMRVPADPGVVPQEDMATDNVPGEPEDEPSYADMKLPHEHDESSKKDTQAPRKKIQQAQRDLAEGKEDTDRYGTTGTAFDEKTRRGGAS